MKTGNRSLPFLPYLFITLISFAVPVLLAQNDPLESGDYSKTNSVTILLGEEQRRNLVSGRGLEHRPRGRDGRTVFETVQGVPCRSLHLTEDVVPKGYFFFTIDPTFKQRDLAAVRIDIDYFDGAEEPGGVFGVQYDAKGSDDNRVLTVKQVLPNIVLHGSGRWLKATFHLKDAGFRNGQSGGSDFRLWASPPELSVSRLTVTVERPEAAPTNAPMAFKDGEAKLADWNLQWDSGSKPSFSRNPANDTGRKSLVIRAPGTFSVGSWRCVVLLDPGQYQFHGKVRTEGLQPEAPEDRVGATLRASGRYSLSTLNEALEWTTLTYDFTVAERDYLELVCELRASAGSARFDLDSLRLMRKTYPAAPPAAPRQP